MEQVFTSTTSKGKTVRVWKPEKTVPQNLQFDQVSVGTSMDDFEEYLKSCAPKPNPLKSQNTTPKKLEEANPPSEEIVDLVSRIKLSL
jgi:hypothetical protein